ncbi:MAG: DUF192 domain-containing protein [Alphaproteobacteria bacterium]
MRKHHGFLLGAVSVVLASIFPVNTLLYSGVFSLSMAASAHAAEADELPAPVSYDTTPLLVQQQGKKIHELKVELAVTPEKMMKGLMFRRSVPDDAGMLFVFPIDQRNSMWMKNTLVSLDMVFIRQDGSISSIYENAEPESLKLITANEPVRAVLELQGGNAKKLGITTDMRVRHPILPDSMDVTEVKKPEQIGVDNKEIVDEAEPLSP